jgi:hypothetical protein
MSLLRLLVGPDRQREHPLPKALKTLRSLLRMRNLQKIQSMSRRCDRLSRSKRVSLGTDSPRSETGLSRD